MKTIEEIQNVINSSRESIRSMLDYMDHKRKEGDWHAVQDAASDLREYEATLETLQWVIK